ncbi:MAG: NYN domain-containing protein [Chloroflexota bacterium]|nr:NYN domain-containing protein [Chloroflexota bacterium]
MVDNQKLLALLIDGDNTQAQFIPHILHTLVDYGDLLITKVFHNKSTIEQWEQVARQYSIEPVWVPNNIKQKNSVDIALVMDAMSLHYERDEIAGFCIVASDGDYTRLARFLKSKGKFVLGMGEAKTPDTFRNACTKFTCLGDVGTASTPAKPAVNATQQEAVLIEEISDKALVKLVINAYQQVAIKADPNQEWAELVAIRSAMISLNPGFTGSTYYKLDVLAKKIQTLPVPKHGLEIRETTNGKGFIHYLTIGANELHKFRQAYNHEDAIKKRDKDGWTPLSIMRNVLGKLDPDFEPLVYRGVKYAQLKKVVEKMRDDYPGCIDLKITTLSVAIRVKS